MARPATSTNMAGDASGRVLVVDDDPQVRELFVDFLVSRFEVEAVGSGEAALEAVSDDVDIVLLDRLMPGRSGSEVLAELENIGYGCRVAMVTAVEPEVDVVDMGFDDYLVKPVSKSDLLNTVDSLLHWADYDAVVEQYFRTARTVAVLEETYTQAELSGDERYEDLLDELCRLQTEADEVVDDLGPERFPDLGSDVTTAADGGNPTE